MVTTQTIFHWLLIHLLTQKQTCHFTTVPVSFRKDPQPLWCWISSWEHVALCSYRVSVLLKGLKLSLGLHSSKCIHPPSPGAQPLPPRAWLKLWNVCSIAVFLLYRPQKSQLKEDDIGPTILPISGTGGWRNTGSFGERRVNLGRANIQENESCPKTNTDLYNIIGFIYWGMSRYHFTDLSE